ncbi:MAG: hypothetical protein J6K31_01065 [Parabacteroides sp.]|nr:hypothetical protein [Parabacteroides sp.]
MEQINEIFFGEHGLTSTSADHLANIAQEIITCHEEKLKNMSFITTKVDIIGSPAYSEKMVNIGYDEIFLQQIPNLLEEMIEMNAFCAWIREAIKAKNSELKKLDEMDAEEWCKKSGIEFYKEPERPKVLCASDIIARMNIKERNEYYQLEAAAATIGKCIHKDGTLSKARNELQCKLVKPINTDGAGREMLIYSHSPSVGMSQVENLFFELQKWHRSNEQKLNKIKFSIKKLVEEENLKNMQEYNVELKKAKSNMMAQLATFNEWQIKERTRLSNLKIVIPNNLQSTYDKLTLLEK